MESLLLRNYQAPGDIVMLTAAVRDLHSRYPGRFRTAVDTTHPELFENNPHLVSMEDLRAGHRVVDCDYRALIAQANLLPFHFLNGFIYDLNMKLDLDIRLTKFHGDIHLSPRECQTFPCFESVSELPEKYWILVAGGKTDMTIKWWAKECYQEVVDRLKGRIIFVQVGAKDHHHPRIDGTVDLRGKTSLRDLIHLVYHAQGILCPVTLAMHLAAAVPLKDQRTGGRPCVVIAGGREPPHWEAYPHHQFIHTVGSLWCCSKGGCWKTRVRPMGDGHENDVSRSFCVDIVGDLPRCMDMITPSMVIDRIELYYRGGILM